MNTDKILLVLLSIVAFTMPFGFIYNINSISILILLLGTVLICFKGVLKIRLDNIYVVFPVLYFSLLLVSILYSDDINSALKPFDKFLSFLLFPLTFILIGSRISKKTVKWLELSFVLGNILGLSYCYLMSLLKYSVDPLPLLKGSFYFSEIIQMHPSYFSMYLVLCMAICLKRLPELKIANGFLKKLIFVIIYVILIFSILFLKSRAGVISLIIFCLLVFFIKVKRSFLLFIVGFVLLILGYVTINYKFINKVAEVDILNRGSAHSIEIRFEIWDAATKVISDSFVFGVGIGDVRKSLDRQFYINGFDLGIDKSYNVHNQYLESFLSGGILLFLVLFGMLIVLLKVYFKTKNIAVIGLLVCSVIGMCFESILVRQHGIIFLNFFYGIYCLKNKE